MLSNAGIYAAKKRKKPVQKIPKPPAPDGAKSNPSKRHRDRLNCELDKLTSLLPFSEDVRARLDKLSVLRLSVGYLKVKSFFNATMKKNNVTWLTERVATFGGNGQSVPTIDGVSFSEGDLLLQALNGFVLVVTAEGYVFYSSPTIQDYLGFHQSDVIHQSVFELIHTDDRATFRSQLHFALNPNQFDEQGTEGMQISNSASISSNIVNYDPQLIPPENSSFLERSFCCRFRCLLDNSSGFLALNFQGRLKFLHGQNKMAEDGTLAHSQLALFAIATPVQPPSILEIRTKTFIFQTKHKLDFTPTGCDSRGKVVLGYTETELCMRGTGYQFIHAADMMYCADNHVRMIKTGESGLTVFRLLTKNVGWVWVQANARLVYKGGRPDFIVARQRALSNEEGEEHLRQRKMQLPFNFATGEAVLYETLPSLEDFTGRSKATKIRKLSEQKTLDPSSILGAMLKQDQSIYVSPGFDPDYSLDKAFMETQSFVSFNGDPWQQENHGQNIIKQEDNAIAMMETLEQLIKENNLCDPLQKLDVDEMELKEWENALLKMDINSDMAIELNDILTNDIFSYVEDALFKESNLSSCGGGMNPGPEQIKALAAVPSNGFVGKQAINQMTFAGLPQNPFNNGPQSCALSKGQSQQNSILPGQQEFNLQNSLLPNHQSPVIAETQSSSLGMGEQSLVEVAGGDGGLQKLTHAGPQIPRGLNSSIQIQPVLQRPQSAKLHNQHDSLEQSEISSQNNLGLNKLIPFNTTLAGSCAQNHNQARHGQPGALGHGSQTFPSASQLQINGMNQMRSGSQATAGHIHPTQLALPLQSPLPPGVQTQQMACQQQAFAGQQNHVGSSQQNQWVSPIPNTNFAENLLQAGPVNASPQQEFLLNPSPKAQLPGHFPVQNQDNKPLRIQSWQQQQQQQQIQQQIPPVLQNGVQYPTELPPKSQMTSLLPNCYNQTQALPNNALAGRLLPQNTQNCRVGFGPQTTNNVYQPLGGLVGNPTAPTNSCMFKTSSSAPVSGIQYNNTGLLVSVPSCQKIKPSPNQSPPQASCYFQRNGSQPIVGTAVIPQEDTSISPLSCQVQPGFSPESLLTQQPFLNCNGQTQIPVHPVEENGSFPYQPLSNRTTYFTEQSQTNCYDY
ncbi:aryl hydrocarbon receptor 2 isoform X2 [Amia ocellicauda]|uniref:aryl hydrocarbon receptor 2 isoform X2 n=1 Tax=Amia ocellicauda TaxID=2972642 RepID=UPI003464E3A3